MSDDRHSSRDMDANSGSIPDPVGGTGVTTVDGCRISYRRAGAEGPAAVLLHGGGVDDSTVSWRHTIEELAETHRVYALDWPGYGDSQNGRSAFEHTTESYSRLLEGFLDGLDLEPDVLMGISMGGAAALGYTLEHHGRVDQLVLVSSYGLGETLPNGTFWKGLSLIPGANAMGWASMGFSSESARLGLASVVADTGGLSDQFVEDFRSRAARTGAGRAFEAFQRNEITMDGSSRTNFVDQLDTLSAPTLLVHGVDDPLFPARWSKRAAERIPNAELALLENCGHWAPRERPKAFHEVLRGFLG